jgi:hypothetical protein
LFLLTTSRAHNLVRITQSSREKKVYYYYFKTFQRSQVLVAYTCNLSYSGGRDQEDCGSRPAQANSSQDPISKIYNTKMTGGVAQAVDPEFKP